LAKGGGSSPCVKFGKDLGVPLREGFHVSNISE
jgi:hypothetical protein